MPREVAAKGWVVSELLSRLKVSTRFVLLGAMAAVLAWLPTALYMREAVSAQSTAAREAAGAAPAIALLKVVQLTQQHRGMTAQLLSGNPGVADARRAKEAETQQAYEALAAALEPGGLSTELRATWSQAQQDWSELRARLASGRLDAAQSFGAHTRLVAHLFEVMDILGDDYGLSLDPELDSYHLIQAALYALPDVTEELGKLRARGSAALVTKALTPETRLAMSTYVAVAEKRLQSMQRSFEKAIARNESIRSVASAALQQSLLQVGQALSLTAEQILNAPSLTYGAPEYFAAMTRSIDGLVQLNARSLDQLALQLESRARAYRLSQQLLLAVLLALAGLGGWLAFHAARSITRQLGGEPADVTDMANAIARGDLSTAIKVRRHDEASIVAAMARMQAALRELVLQVRQSSESIAAGSAQIAAGTADLSQRTEEQAANLQQTAASMDEINATVAQHAETAQTATTLAEGASAAAVKGGAVVGQVVSTMEAIAESSKTIAEIVGVIDAIAFQTNILALNASVEAARAGEQGRGFAVVAGEVRSLAQRSAESARQIRTLIGSSAERVDSGARLVEDAGSAMNELVAQVQRVEGLMGEMSRASQEQVQGLGQVGQAVAQLDDVTQRNAGLVEQSAAAADSLKAQAQRLTEVVSVFRLADAAAATH